jgi:hypothetical protein
MGMAWQVRKHAMSIGVLGNWVADASRELVSLSVVRKSGQATLVRLRQYQTPTTNSQFIFFYLAMHPS